MPSTGKRRIRTKRWLFTHPSHLQWWYSKNLERYPDNKNLITGIINGYYEGGSKTNGIPNDSEQHHNKWKDFAESMGWDYMPCLRFSHTSTFKYRQWLFDSKNHEKIVQKALKWGSIALDMEPYGLGYQGYHRQSEALELNRAARVWKSCSVPVAIYPSLYTAPEVILSNCCNSIVLDHTTYNGQSVKDWKKDIQEKENYFLLARRFSTYWVGLFLAYLKDKETIDDIRPHNPNMWFFPRNSDDRRNFFTPEWTPVK